MANPSTDALTQLLAPVVASKGFDLDAVELHPSKAHRSVTVVIDGDNGVDLDAIADVSRSVSDALDDSDLMGESAYNLEVTSRGVSRPLTLPRHWRRNIGRLARVATTDGRTITGRIQTASDDSQTVGLDVDGTAAELSLDEVDKATIEIEFNRPKEAGNGH